MAAAGGTGTGTGAGQLRFGERLQHGRQPDAEPCVQRAADQLEDRVARLERRIGDSRKPVVARRVGGRDPDAHNRYALADALRERGHIARRQPEFAHEHVGGKLAHEPRQRIIERIGQPRPEQPRIPRRRQHIGIGCGSASNAHSLGGGPFPGVCRCRLCSDGCRRT